MDTPMPSPNARLPLETPPLTQQETQRQAREQRVAAALRANLLKRKQQARARAATDSSEV